MASTTTEAEEFARLALGSRALKNRRIRRAIIARLLNENGETNNGDEAEEVGEEGGDEPEFLRTLLASRMLRKRRVRRALLTHLLRGKAEAEVETDEGDEGFGEDTGDDEKEIVRTLIASRVLRRRRVRRALLAHLLRSGGGGGGGVGIEAEGDDSEYSDGDGDGEDDDRVLARALIGSRILRHRRVRRALLAHMLNERQEATG
jgi:hypothetical protein